MPIKNAVFHHSPLGRELWNDGYKPPLGGVIYLSHLYTRHHSQDRERWGTMGTMGTMAYKNPRFIRTNALKNNLLINLIRNSTSWQ